MSKSLTDLQHTNLGISKEQLEYAKRFEDITSKGYWATRTEQPMDPITKKKRNLKPSQIIESYAKFPQNTKKEISNQETKMRQKFQKMLTNFRGDNLKTIYKENDIETLLRSYILNIDMSASRRKIFMAVEQYIAGMQREIVKLKQKYPEVKLPNSNPPIKDLVDGFKATENFLIREANYGYKFNLLEPKGDRINYFRLTNERRTEIRLEGYDADEQENFIGSTSFILNQEDLAKQRRANKRANTGRFGKYRYKKKRFNPYNKDRRNFQRDGYRNYTHQRNGYNGNNYQRNGSKRNFKGNWNNYQNKNDQNRDRFQPNHRQETSWKQGRKEQSYRTKQNEKDNRNFQKY